MTKCAHIYIFALHFHVQQLHFYMQHEKKQ